MPRPSLSKEARQMMLQYSYLGNIRELENLIKLLYVLCRGGQTHA
ncbi:hypothetical protein [Rufibacter tibetensis]|nr:hypothetical protein [Rufibacter tibetensis]